MIAQRILYTTPEGDLIIIAPAYNDLARPKDDTDDALVERLVAGAFPSGTMYRIISEETCLADIDACEGRIFRGAWEDNGIAIQVNMTKARAIHIDRIRKVRNAELAKLDIPWMKAVEDGDTDMQATIKAKKQELRDIPQTFDLTTDTPKELKEKWPEGLPKE